MALLRIIELGDQFEGLGLFCKAVIFLQHSGSAGEFLPGFLEAKWMRVQISLGSYFISDINDNG